MVAVFVIAIVVLIGTWFGVRWMRAWAARHQILDYPNARSSHSVPTPRGGGLAIVVATLLGVLVSLLVHLQISFRSAFGFILGGSLIAGVSWLDDLKSLPSYLRFAVHSLVAGIMIFLIGPVQSVYFPLFGAVDLAGFQKVITFFWIVGLINVYNFMDGIDGIAATQAIIAGLGWMFVGEVHNLELVLWIAVLLLSSSIGFLWYNWTPARIFMGDVGSAFLGYSFATLLLFSDGSCSKISTAGVLFVWPFLFDAVFTISRRALNGENVFTAHRSHLYQRLVIVGYNHALVTILYSMLGVVSTVSALLWLESDLSDEWVVAITVSLSLSMLLYVKLKERH